MNNIYKTNVIMKKFFYFALVSAIALTGTLGFTACTSEDNIDQAETNPNYDETTGLVKSQFVLNIASQTQTRSSATTVQNEGQNFRGIDNTLLFAYNTSGKRFIDGTSAAAAAASRYDLGMVAAAGSLNDNDKSHRILELAMPTGTDAMLFYGKAIKGSSTPDYNEIGKVTYSVTGSKATGFHFDLMPRIGGDGARFTATAELLAAIMTKIVNVSGTYTVNNATYPDWTGAATLTSTWKDLNPTTQGRALSPLEEILYKAFHALTTYGANELRGGSSQAVLTTVRDLYSVTTKVVAATATSPYEELARHIASAINGQITSYFTSITDNPINGFRGVDGIKSSYGDGWKDGWNAVTDEELADFPIVNFTLPEGCAQLAYAPETNTFTHKSTGNSLLDKAVTTDPDAYQFPAELMYYCNSGVRTSNTEKTDAKYPNGVSNWDTESSWTTNGWEAGSTTVTSATRATAMEKNVNYGVAMLKSTVQIKEGLASLEDNRAALNPGESNNTFNPGDIDFTWTGLIIGGQPGSVDWQFLPTTSFDKMIYDNRITGLAAGTALPGTAGSASAANYTIVFDNYTTAATQNNVLVALQFKNNGADFWGRDNLIRKGQTFYLVTTLNPTGKDVTWDSHYQIPPLNASGVSTQTPRVFIQDYMTVAKFRLIADAGAHTSSLQNAYVTIPDLRSSQLSFGLSVDLEWRTGMDFDADLGGN
jgi:hypothetical protein